MAAPTRFLCGHVEEAVTPPPGFTLRCLMGQYAELRDADDNLYLIADGGEAWQMHRRITPEANGHARNALEYGPPVGFPKNAQ